LLPCRRRPVREPARLARPAGAALVALELALLLVATPAAAFKVSSIRPARDSEQRLWVELQIEDVIEPRVEASLERGMPATLTIRTELWRRRNGWFDRLERTAYGITRIRRDVANENWRIERRGSPPLVVPTLDSLRQVLEKNTTIPVGPLERLGTEAPCYVVVIAALQPLQLEDVEEVEAWLSGEVKSKGSSPFGFLTGLPRSLFDAVRNFAGFGDERSRLISAEFTPANVPQYTQ
jgi:hypothetical protein